MAFEDSTRQSVAPARPTVPMSERVRGVDWSRTPLGPVGRWPDELRVAVDICLSSRFPMFVWWGPELINIYNDAYVPMLGERHPAALGRPARATWDEIWPVIGPQAEAVIARGESTWNERVRLVIARNGYPEDTYFTWSYSPIRDAAGAVRGLFCAVTEETERVRVEADRDRLAAQRQLALDAARMGWWHYDPATRNATFDRRYAEIVGVAGSQRPNDEILRRLHPDDLPAVWAKVEAALDPANPRPYSAEYRVQLDDGSVRWVEAHGTATFEGDGVARRATSLVGTVADVTERKCAEVALRESDERARLLVQAARQLGSSLDPNAIYTRLRDTISAAMPLGGLVVSSYDPADRMIRCAYAWLSGNVLDPATLPPLRFNPDTDGGGMQSQVIRTGRPLLFNDVVERVTDPRATYYEINPDGTKRNLGRNAPPANVRSAIMVPLLSAGAVGGVVQVMSNAERAYAERHLALLEGITLQLSAALANARLYRRAHDELEERRRVEAQLREAKEAAEAASRAKGEFLATLSHELRTPLTPVLLTVSLIETHPDLPQDVREDVATIRRNVELESRLISDLLDLTRIERGKLQLDLHDVDLHLILRSAIDICRREAPAELTTDLRAARHTVRGDGTRLQQVFWNLINNAIKFTPPHGTITVRTRDAGDGRVRVEVADTGAGIDPAVLPRLFSAFEQGEVRAARQQAGLGLGLSISKKLTEAHGGTISVTSEGRGRGATFVVELPAVEPLVRMESPVVPASAMRPAAAARPLNVLLVEDHEPTLRVLERLLRQIGHRVTGVPSVTAALAAAAQGAFDLIISDLGLPDGSGLDVMRRLRDSFGGRAIALTGYGMDADVAASRDAGFAEHLTKPVDLTQLESAIGRVTLAAPVR